MALLLSNAAKGLKPVPSVMSALVAGLLYEFVVDSATPLAAGDIIDLGDVPPDVQGCDCTLISDDVSTAADITLSVGFLNAAKTDLASANETFIAASTVGQAGGVARATTPNTLLYGTSGATGKRLGIKVVAGGTGSALGKKIAVKLDVNA